MTDLFNFKTSSLPKDWELKLFDDLFDFSGGFSASRSQLSNKGYCYLHYGDIHTTNKTYVDVAKSFQDIPKLNIDFSNISANSLLKDGDVVFVDASEDEEGITKHLVIINKNDLPFISGLHTIVAKNKTNKLQKNFLQFCFKTEFIRQQFLFYAAGAKVLGISRSNIRKIVLPFPTSIEEQKHIASILIDVDKLVDNLGKLILKKKNIMLATMQQLLNKKIRLRGFTKEWKKKRLGEILAYEQPNKYLVNSTNYKDIFDTPVLTAGKTFYLGHTNETNGVYNNLPAIIFDDFTTVSKYVNFKFKAKSSAMKILTLRNKSSNLEFIYQIMQMIQFKIGEHKRHWISEYSKLEVNIPDKDEQDAITNILSFMQKEINSLMKNKDKALKLKISIMQELLSGKTRLIKSDVANDG